MAALRSLEQVFGHGEVVAELPIPERVENRRRSVAMLPPGAPALNRDEALELLEQLKAALLELRRIRVPTRGDDHRPAPERAIGAGSDQGRRLMSATPDVPFGASRPPSRYDVRCACYGASLIGISEGAGSVK